MKCKVSPNKGSIGKVFCKESKDVINLINNSKLADLLDNKVYYKDNLITSEFYKLSSDTFEKDEYYSINSGIYLILLDKTIDDNILMKMKLNLWKREIQELRKKLNYHIWDKLELLIDESTIDSNKFDDWKLMFEKLLNSKISYAENLDICYQFNYNNESIKYQLKEIN